MRSSVVFIAVSSLVVTACVDTVDGGRVATPQASGVDEAGVDETYRRLTQGCRLSEEQHAVMRPAYRDWVARLGGVLTDPVMLAKLIFKSKRQSESELGAQAQSVSGDLGATARRVMSPEQLACFQGNWDRQGQH